MQTKRCWKWSSCIKKFNFIVSAPTLHSVIDRAVGTALAHFTTEVVFPRNNKQTVSRTSLLEVCALAAESASPNGSGRGHTIHTKKSGSSAGSMQRCDRCMWESLQMGALCKALVRGTWYRSKGHTKNPVNLRKARRVTQLQFGSRSNLSHQLTCVPTWMVRDVHNPTIPFPAWWSSLVYPGAQLRYMRPLPPLLLFRVVV
eukprot:3851666-Amphidinium_carterae.1